MLRASASLPMLGIPIAQVVHTTGDGLTAQLVAKVGDDGQRLGLAAVEWYETIGMELYGHSLIDPAGNVYELATESKAAQHAKSLHVTYTTSHWSEYAKPLGEADWTRHERPPGVVFDWWYARLAAHWPGVKGPLDLVGRYPNNCTLAIDLLPAAGGGYTEVQVAAARQLLEDRAARHSLPFDRRHVLGHEDIDPCRRGCVRRRGRVVGTPWDPGQAFWAGLRLES